MHARASRGSRETRETCTFSHARGHLRVSHVWLDGLRKRRDCSVLFCPRNACRYRFVVDHLVWNIGSVAWQPNGGELNLVLRVLSYAPYGASERERDPGKRWSRVSKEDKKTGFPVSESFIATKFCKHQNEAASHLFIVERILSVFCQRDTENL